MWFQGPNRNEKLSMVKALPKVKRSTNLRILNTSIGRYMNAQMKHMTPRSNRVTKPAKQQALHLQCYSYFNGIWLPLFNNLF